MGKAVAKHITKEKTIAKINSSKGKTVARKKGTKGTGKPMAKIITEVKKTGRLNGGKFSSKSPSKHSSTSSSKSPSTTSNTGSAKLPFKGSSTGSSESPSESSGTGSAMSPSKSSSTGSLKSTTTNSSMGSSMSPSKSSSTGSLESPSTNSSMGSSELPSIRSSSGLKSTYRAAKKEDAGKGSHTAWKNSKLIKNTHKSEHVLKRSIEKRGTHDCPPAFTASAERDNCFLVTFEYVTYAEAVEYCDNYQGALVSIQSKEKQDAVQTFLKSNRFDKKATIWLSPTRNSSDHLGWEADGQIMDYTNFQEDIVAPLMKQCLLFNMTSGRWIKQLCDEYVQENNIIVLNAHHVICEPINALGPPTEIGAADSEGPQTQTQTYSAVNTGYKKNSTGSQRLSKQSIEYLRELLKSQGLAA